MDLTLVDSGLGLGLDWEFGLRLVNIKNRTKIIYAADNHPSSEEYRREIQNYDRIHIVKSDKVPSFKHHITILKHSFTPSCKMLPVHLKARDYKSGMSK